MRDIDWEAPGPCIARFRHLDVFCDCEDCREYDDPYQPYTIALSVQRAFLLRDDLLWWLALSDQYPRTQAELRGFRARGAELDAWLCDTIDVDEAELAVLFELTETIDIRDAYYVLERVTRQLDTVSGRA